MVSTDAIAVALTVSAALLLRELIRRRMSGDNFDEESEYSGTARNPDALESADDQALEELDRLLEIYGADTD